MRLILNVLLCCILTGCSNHNQTNDSSINAKSVVTYYDIGSTDQCPRYNPVNNTGVMRIAHDACIAMVHSKELMAKNAGINEANANNRTDTAQQSNTMPSTVENSAANNQAKDILSFYESDIVLGNKNAKIVVIEYTAFTCTHCSTYHSQFFPMIDRDFIKTNKITYVVREFVGNLQDAHAALLARCGLKVGDMGLYTNLRTILFEQQSGWAFNKWFTDKLTRIGQIAGIGQQEYNACMLDQKLQQNLANHGSDIAAYMAANNKKFVGTPLFILNGEIVSKPYYDLHAAISRKVHELGLDDSDKTAQGK